MNENLSSEQWRGFRRPFQGSPQQGTLFDKRGVERAPDNSPGAVRQRRRQQMVGAMPKAWAGETLPEHAEVKAKVEQRRDLSFYDQEGMPPRRRDTAARNMASDAAGRGLRAEMGKRLADETTVTPEHLEGLDRIDVGQSPQGVGEGQYMWPTFQPGAAAHYSQDSANGPRIQSPRPMSTGTLTHEIGHHVSLHQQGNTASGSRATTRSGLNVDLAEEGRADAFALEHAGDKRDFTYASLDARHGPLATGQFENFRSPYRMAREQAGQPLRDWERSEQQPPRPLGMEESPAREMRQSEVFTTEQAEIDLPYMGVPVDVNVYRPNPVLDRGNRPVGFEVQPGQSSGRYEVEGGHLDPRDVGYYWKTREGEERTMANYVVEDGVTVDTLEKDLTRSQR